MNTDPRTMQQKIYLRRAGWTWNRKLRQWESPVDHLTPRAVKTVAGAMLVQLEEEHRAALADIAE